MGGERRRKRQSIDLGMAGVKNHIERRVSVSCPSSQAWAPCLLLSPTLNLPPFFTPLLLFLPSSLPFLLLQALTGSWMR